ncbi:hypothetical protein I316_00921 [Kwoniella heveanensis BCC8398]|uniref:Right handed beta helix domain-containing protein n=1 Tax=Kwoniella heveanensis BCC8398 TaxID=1296120 RepID=A0A1B9H191_9TREE|nr:hypothetical protein I316_00921 [Kwoniella heveanensis BCC8398]
MVYELQDSLNYTAANQEISTEGYPTDDSRATVVMVGFNKTTSIKATDADLSGTKLLNIQVNGNRKDNEDIYTAGGANIEFGGANQNQLVKHVRSYDPRGWSCLHIAEGPFSCANVTIQNNDIGPCGRDYFQNWADGISLSCADSLVQNNVITDATDGGIVIFGAPSSTIRNNTIRVRTRTMLGGINMVDVVPWLPEGNFSNTLVDSNIIHGGFATSLGNDTKGPQNASAIIKMGIAIGPDVWFSDGRYGTNQSTGATVQNNVFSGAFAYGMGLSSARSFVIQNNSFTGNTSFIGSYGPNCTTGSETPHPPVPLLMEPSSITNLTLSVPSDSEFQFVNGTALGLTCLMPPGQTENAWPYGDGFNAGGSDVGSSASTSSAPSSTGTGSSGSGGNSKDNSAASGLISPTLSLLSTGVAVGILGVFAAGVGVL